MIARNRFAKLLQGPGCRWMRSDVAMHDAPCPDLHQEEHIESSEPSSHHDQEIAGDDGLGMIADTSSSSAKRSSGGLVAPVREANRRGPYAEKRRYPASPTALPRALVPKLDSLCLLDPAKIVENIHDAYDHPRFRDKAYSLLMSGPSGSADIGGITVHPAQGVMTLTVIFWPRA